MNTGDSYKSKDYNTVEFTVECTEDRTLALEVETDCAVSIDAIFETLELLGFKVEKPSWYGIVIK